MLVQVIYPNGKYDMVKGFVLAQLIREGSIQSFRRANGWVTIGVDRVRESLENRPFVGEDRRDDDFPFHNRKKNSIQ